jgi:hypothetical protein
MSVNCVFITLQLPADGYNTRPTAVGDQKIKLLAVLANKTERNMFNIKCIELTVQLENFIPSIVLTGNYQN